MICCETEAEALRAMHACVVRIPPKVRLRCPGRINDAPLQVRIEAVLAQDWYRLCLVIPQSRKELAKMAETAGTQHCWRNCKDYFVT